MSTLKGITNEGENNCFLNVIVQILYHFDNFRTSFADSNNHSRNASQACTRYPCISCSLHNIFNDYQSSTEGYISPAELRIALSTDFHLGSMADAAEAYSYILESITSEQPADSNIVSATFLMKIMEVIHCNDCSSETKSIVDTFVLDVYAQSIRDLYLVSPSTSLSELIHQTHDQDLRPCPNQDCQNRLKNYNIPILRALTNSPPIITISLVWAAGRVKDELLKDVLDLLSSEINMKELFSKAIDEEVIYTVKGMICYYGSHYVTLIWEAAKQTWFFFDDMNVKQVGTKWLDVKTKCLQNRYQPSLIFYEKLCNLSYPGDPSDNQPTVPIKSIDYFNMTESNYDYLAKRKSAPVKNSFINWNYTKDRPYLNRIDQPLHRIDQPFNRIDQPLHRIDQPFNRIDQPLHRMGQPWNTIDQPVYRTGTDLPFNTNRPEPWDRTPMFDPYVSRMSRASNELRYLPNQDQSYHDIRSARYFQEQPQYETSKYSTDALLHSNDHQNYVDLPLYPQPYETRTKTQRNGIETSQSAFSETSSSSNQLPKKYPDFPSSDSRASKIPSKPSQLSSDIPPSKPSEPSSDQPPFKPSKPPPLSLNTQSMHSDSTPQFFQSHSAPSSPRRIATTAASPSRWQYVKNITSYVLSWFSWSSYTNTQPNSTSNSTSSSSSSSSFVSKRVKQSEVLREDSENVLITGPNI